MQNFLNDVIQKELNDDISLSNMVFVLPSKRAGTFVKRLIVDRVKKTSFAPEIYSIEDFVEKLSGLSYANNTQQLFELYKAYKNTNTGDLENFHEFSKWGQTLLQDFNEIDRYLIEPNKLFTNLAAVQELSHWSVSATQTPMMQGYLKFWNSLTELYNTFNQELLKLGVGHQGLVYRQACQNIKNYIQETSNKKHVFIGFNALNKSESLIIQKLLATNNTSIYWDIDSSFLNDTYHDAGYFVRQYKKTWPSLHGKELKGISNTYYQNKKIEITGVPKHVAQAKLVGTLLTTIQEKSPEQLKSTAVILADESLLNPILNSVPSSIESVNITMGYPLKKTPLSDFFNQLIQLHLHEDVQGWYYKNVLAILGHSYIQTVFNDYQESYLTTISETIKKQNLTFLTSQHLESILKDIPLLSLIFFTDTVTPLVFIKNCQQVILALKKKFTALDDLLALEYLYRFNTLFLELEHLVEKHGFISDLKTLKGLYIELLSTERVNFEGNPLDGLQIMGMLESRNLDFETVIITSVNEGVLPAGKSNNSFIPYDLKKGFGLPTYKEKDAVYTYHFYRLLQRAKNIHIIYNTEPNSNGLEGGEKSRLISQLLTDEKLFDKIHNAIAAPKLIRLKQTAQAIEKDQALLALIKEFAAKGFSPSSLTTYIRNPIDFYKRHLLNIKLLDEVEESVAYNTFGTILHDTLEELYKPLIGHTLTKENLKALKPKIKEVSTKHFTASYKGSDITKGKNLIAFNVIMRYLQNFIDNEIEEVKNHEIKIIGLETPMNIELKIDTINYPIKLKGKLDRVDTKDGMIRIIDFKSGTVEASKLGIVDWQEDLLKYEYSKAFQLLCYALMYQSKVSAPFMAGIISFKNLNAGLLAFGVKETRGSRSKNTSINDETLAEFKEVLFDLIREICNPSQAFVEKKL